MGQIRTNDYDAFITRGSARSHAQPLREVQNVHPDALARPMADGLQEDTAMKLRTTVSVLACLVVCASAASSPSSAEPGPGTAPAAPASASASAPAPPAARAPAPASALPGEGFASLGEERGVKVYRREKLPGIELAAEGVLKGTPDQVRRVLLDYPNHKRWQKHLKENKVLVKTDSTLDVYQRLSLPVLDDRDFTLRVSWGSEKDVLWMRFAAAKDRGPAPVSGVVRVTAHQGSWRLEPIKGGKATHAVYRFHIDLAGSFPSWMGKGQATSDVTELFENITRELPRYP
jgi:hypothetical protein